MHVFEPSTESIKDKVFSGSRLTTIPSSRLGVRQGAENVG